MERVDEWRGGELPRRLRFANLHLSSLLSSSSNRSFPPRFPNLEEGKGGGGEREITVVETYRVVAANERTIMVEIPSIIKLNRSEARRNEKRIRPSPSSFVL